MTKKRITWVSRICIILGLSFLFFTLLLLLFEYGYGADFVSYISYVLVALGGVLALFDYFQSERGKKQQQVGRGSRFFVGLGLSLLIFAMIFLLLKNDYGANFAANTSYVFLVIGVVLALVEYFQSEWGESKKERG